MIHTHFCNSPVYCVRAKYDDEEPIVVSVTSLSVKENGHFSHDYSPRSVDIEDCDLRQLAERDGLIYIPKAAAAFHSSTIFRNHTHEASIEDRRVILKRRKDPVTFSKFLPRWVWESVEGVTKAVRYMDEINLHSYVEAVIKTEFFNAATPLEFRVDVRTSDFWLGGVVASAPELVTLPECVAAMTECTWLFDPANVLTLRY